MVPGATLGPVVPSQPTPVASNANKINAAAVFIAVSGEARAKTRPATHAAGRGEVIDYLMVLTVALPLERLAVVVPPQPTTDVATTATTARATSFFMEISWLEPFRTGPRAARTLGGPLPHP